VQFAFPFAWLFEDKRWVPRKDTFIRDPTASSPIQIWNLNCIQCHSTAGRPILDRRTGLYSSRVGEIGIACESCHGPAEEHVKANLDPRHRYVVHRKPEGDSTIVNPARLQPKASTQVCGQCHSIKWNVHREDWMQNGFRYRPGDELEKLTPLVRPKKFDSEPRLPESLKHDRNFLDMIFWPDGIIRVTGREYNGLLESACHERGNLTCIGCHSMHHSDPDDQLAAGMSGNEACFKCHDSLRSRVQQHTHHLVTSSGSQCYNCHMPHDTYGLLKAVRSHYIGSPNVETSLEAGRPNACNLCHLDKTLDWTAKHLTEWYKKEPLHLGENENTISAAVQWLLRGDAAQRTLVAWNLGWQPAREASGELWLVPYLAELLDDPYSAVRYIAYRSLRQIPGFGSLKYDYVGPKADLAAARKQVLEAWEETDKSKLDRKGPEILINAQGEIDRAKVDQLLQQRDNRPVELIE
jgi:predicted CXXCH cytochrome family protein